MRIIFLLLIILYGCNDTSIVKKENPPIAKKISKTLSIHGDERVDNYFWMRLSDEQKKSSQPDQQTQDVIDYLNAENRYLKSKMKHTEDLQEQLFNEIKDRIKKDEQELKELLAEKEGNGVQCAANQYGVIRGPGGDDF